MTKILTSILKSQAARVGDLSQARRLQRLGEGFDDEARRDFAEIKNPSEGPRRRWISNGGKWDTVLPLKKRRNASSSAITMSPSPVVLRIECWARAIRTSCWKPAHRLLRYSAKRSSFLFAANTPINLKFCRRPSTRWKGPGSAAFAKSKSCAGRRLYLRPGHGPAGDDGGQEGLAAAASALSTVVGLMGKPTVVNNVETFPCCSHRANGGEWFAKIGVPGNPEKRFNPSGGTGVYSISGDVEKPGIYEFPWERPCAR